MTSNIDTERCLTPDELTDTLIRVMQASLRRLRTMKTISAADRKMVMAVLTGMDVTDYRSEEKRFLTIEIHRESNRI